MENIKSTTVRYGCERTANYSAPAGLSAKQGKAMLDFQITFLCPERMAPSGEEELQRDFEKFGRGFEA